MRPYFEKMQEWNKPVKVNAKNAEEIKAVEKEIDELVDKAKKAGLAQETLNKRGEWQFTRGWNTLRPRYMGPASHAVRSHGRGNSGQRLLWTVSAE
jgi:hypothetical protein